MNQIAASKWSLKQAKMFRAQFGNAIHQTLLAMPATLPPWEATARITVLETTLSNFNIAHMKVIELVGDNDQNDETRVYSAVYQNYQDALARFTAFQTNNMFVNHPMANANATVGSPLLWNAGQQASAPVLSVAAVPTTTTVSATSAPITQNQLQTALAQTTGKPLPSTSALATASDIENSKQKVNTFSRKSYEPRPRNRNNSAQRAKPHNEPEAQPKQVVAKAKQTPVVAKAKSKPEELKVLTPAQLNQEWRNVRNTWHGFRLWPRFIYKFEKGVTLAALDESTKMRALRQAIAGSAADWLKEFEDGKKYTFLQLMAALKAHAVAPSY